MVLDYITLAYATLAKLPIKTNDYRSVIACTDAILIYHVVCQMMAILACKKVNVRSRKHIKNEKFFADILDKPKEGLKQYKKCLKGAESKPTVHMKALIKLAKKPSVKYIFG